MAKTITQLENILLNKLKELGGPDAFYESHGFTQMGDKIVRGPHVTVYLSRKRPRPSKFLKNVIKNLVNEFYGKAIAYHPSRSVSYGGRDWWQFDVTIVKPAHWREPKPF